MNTRSAGAGPPSKISRLAQNAEEEEDDYVAMDELSQTIPSSAPIALDDEEDEGEEEAEESGDEGEDGGDDVQDPDDPDLSDPEPEAEPEPEPEAPPPEPETTASGRPKRAAAANAMKNVTSWMVGKNAPATAPEPTSSAARPAASSHMPKSEPPPKKKSARNGPEFADEDIVEEDGDGLKSPDGLPVYGRKTLTFAAAEQLLLVPDSTHEGKATVSNSIPVYCPNQKGGFTFLIDAAALYKIEDIPVDGYGSWTAGGSRASSRSRYYVQMPNGDLMRVDSTIKHNREPAHWDLKLTQTRYVHPAAARCFRKLTYCVRDREGGVKRWAAVTYQWLSEPFSFKPLPHGNCKGGKKELKPFQRTYPSVLAAMKQQLPLRMPKTVLDEIQGAYGSGTQPLPAIPRDRKQLYNLNREAVKETGQNIDHRKWRKTGPAAGQPPGAELYLDEEGGHFVEDITYIIEESAIPGIPDDQLAVLQETAEALLEEPARFRDSEENPLWCTVEDGGLNLAVRADAMEDGRLRCSNNCPEFRVFRNLCQHTLAVAQRRGKLDEHMSWVRAVKSAVLGSATLLRDDVAGPSGVLEEDIASSSHHDDQLQGEPPEYELVPDHQVLMGREEIVVAGSDDFPSNIMMTG